MPKHGEEFFNIKNLTKFCRERNISVSSIRDLINGNIKKKSYKGCRLNYQRKKYNEISEAIKGKTEKSIIYGSIKLILDTYK